MLLLNRIGGLVTFFAPYVFYFKSTDLGLTTPTPLGPGLALLFSATSYI